MPSSDALPLILGLDVGGTQTDAVLVSCDGVVASAVKVPTRADLPATLRKAVDQTLSGTGPDRISRMAFSTTMATNAIVQDRLDPAGMIVSAGPGMDPQGFAVGPSYHVVEGCLDHRGYEARPLSKEAVLAAAAGIRDQGIQALGLVSKFSVRNPAHELCMAEWVKEIFPHPALGHQVSGHLNFPRRIATTYLNAALRETHERFVRALLGILEERDLRAPRYLLKPDGGTVGLEESLGFPARTAQSGPAASIMGALALDPCPGTTLVLDVGGTTTDIGLIYRGAPLLEPYGIHLGPYKTLIRSLQTRSVGIGGDSEVRAEPGRPLRIGPLRQGPPAALGGPAPPPTDAMIVLGHLDAGDKETARRALEPVAAALDLDVLKAASAVLDRMAELIADSVGAFLHYINARPVYTVREVLEGVTIEPGHLVLLGGPAVQLAAPLESAFGLPCSVPPHAEVANAIGAAVSRVTCEITLHADTVRGTVVVPEAGIDQFIDGEFDLDQGMIMARQSLEKAVSGAGGAEDDLEITVTEQQSFNMIQGFSRTGRNIRLNLCVTPGLIPGWPRRS
ncbi:MAG: hydantoinase/oxoprolinase family protein [Deltaproteobacteria bacterium]|nr:hydantoinase/oxoprolinase family protein [Deltaproteobacteria bacterium]